MINNVLNFLSHSVEKYPHKTLFAQMDGASISYQEFDMITSKLASFLVEKNIYNSPILIILPKSIDALIAFFATLKSGNYYTIVDEKSPKERLDKIIEILEPKLIVKPKNYQYDFAVESISIDREWLNNIQINDKALKHILARHIDTNLTYVLFTSGSTGTPKGVAISHKSVIDYTFWVCETFNFTEHQILANQAPLYFDNSVLDIYPTIKAGGTLHLLPNATFAFPKFITDYLNNHKINTIFWVPSVLIYFANTNAIKDLNHNLQQVLFCGEIMPNKQLNMWRKALPHVKFANLYGPTEITDVCSFYKVDRQFKDEEILPIGKACNNTELLVFDENLNLIPQHKAHNKGELYVRGTSLSLGYYNDQDKTKKAFIQNPLHNKYLDLLYKTGDIVAYNEYGELLCYGRVDNQIKYLGHRIELGEIENIINAHESIDNCACIFKEDIILFYESKIKLTEDDIKQYVKDKLPSYMIPKQFIKIDKFALNQNGKIDRKVLHTKI